MRKMSKLVPSNQSQSKAGAIRGEAPCLGLRFSQERNRMARTALVVAGLLMMASGCQTIKPTWPANLFGTNTAKVKESKYAPPARLAIMWSPAVLNQAGQVPTRGFGGRVYFYDAKNNPVAVEGQLVIYAYNNDKPQMDSRVPDKKFAFTPEQFTQHYSPTELGASYSIWIPWDAMGSAQSDVSLVPIFTSSSGALVMGQSSRNLLPGPTTNGGPNSIDPSQPAVNIRQSAITGDPTRRDYGVQPVSYQQSVSSNQPQPPNMAAATVLPPNGAPGLPQTDERGGVSTMSITLPGTLTDRLTQAPPQMSTMQKLAQLRQEALAKQGGIGQPASLNGMPGSLAANSAAAGAPNYVNAAALNTGPQGAVAAANGARALQSAGAVPPPWMPGPTPQPARSELPSPPALGGLSLPQVAGPPPSRPAPAAQPSYHPPGSPQSFPTVTYQEPSSGGLR